MRRVWFRSGPLLVFCFSSALTAAWAHSGHSAEIVRHAARSPVAVQPHQSKDKDAFEVPGQVIVDPRRWSRVAADQAGFLEPPQGGFPVAGSSVRATQVLAYLRPNIPQPERRDLDADLAVAQRDVKLGALQVQRFNANEADQFDGQIPLPSIQILGDYRSAQVRQAQLQSVIVVRASFASTRTLRSAIRWP